MPRNKSRKSYSFSIPIVFRKMIDMLEDRGIIASKSEAVRCALSEWLLINMDLMKVAEDYNIKPTVSMDSRTERLWKNIFELVNEYNRSFGGELIND